MTATATQVRERPILFSGPMVRAILDGRKSQTRRILKPQPIVKAKGGMTSWRWSPRSDFDGDDSCGWGPADDSPPMTVALDALRRSCPYGQSGDRLWVRETWCPSPDGPIYRATEHERGVHQPDDWNAWKPSIHMPRWASRLTLEITAVRVERIQECSEADAKAEGAPREPTPVFPDSTYLRGFERRWNALNEKRGYGWAANPWVWVIGFRRIVVAQVAPLDRKGE